MFRNKKLMAMVKVITLIMVLALFFAAKLMAGGTVNMLPGTVNLPQTGQTTCWDTSTYNSTPCTNTTGQDGNTKAGVPWPTSRFADNGNGTITDTLTGLIWLKNANCFGTVDWATALIDAKGLTSVGNECGLFDGSTAGQWRLPNVNELMTLVNLEESDMATWLNTPAQPGFSNVQSDYYWSSSTYAILPSYAWIVNMYGGYDSPDGKAGTFYYVWPVRGGQP